MKIGIVTLYSAFNYGAYLQAYATQKKLIELGHEPQILDLETAASLRARYRTLISKRLSTMVFNVRKYLAFRSAWKQLLVCAHTYDPNVDRFDAMVLGSDEIWNVCNPTFSAVPQYFGIGLTANRLISYAPSASESSLADLKLRAGAIDGMKGIDYLSVRDEKTASIVREATGRVPVLVLDPTFLVDFAREVVLSRRRRFVLVYTYGFNPERISEVTTFARKRGLELISAGFNNDWCDVVLAATPFEFLGLVKAADYVVTDTFHGTIFSILFKKQFASYAANKMKVSYLLSSLGLGARILDGAGDFDATLEAAIDYEKVDTSISALRARSIGFLEHSLALES